MVNSCSASGCKNKNEKGVNLTFHRFPLSNPNLLNKWMYQLKKGTWQPSKYNVLCSAHFTDDCFQIKGPMNRRTLKKDSCPTIFGVQNFTQVKKKRVFGRGNVDVDGAEEEEGEDNEEKMAAEEKGNGENEEEAKGNGVKSENGGEDMKQADTKEKNGSEEKAKKDEDEEEDEDKEENQRKKLKIESTEGKIVEADDKEEAED